MVYAGALPFIVPKLSYFQLLTPSFGGRKAHSYATLLNLWGRFILARKERSLVPIFLFVPDIWYFYGLVKQRRSKKYRTHSWVKIIRGIPPPI
jgi:hypothetical protein